MTRHHWECGWNFYMRDRDCDCGLAGPRAWDIDLLPHDRAATEAEVEAWRRAVQERESKP